MTRVRHGKLMKTDCQTKAHKETTKALPGAMGNRGKGQVYFRGTWKQRPNFEGNMGAKTILGNLEHKKLIFDFWGTGQFILGEQGNK